MKVLSLFKFRRSNVYEVLEACQAENAILRQENQRLKQLCQSLQHDLGRFKAKVLERNSRINRRIEKMLYACADKSEGRQKQFVNGLQGYFYSHGTLTAAQIVALRDIYRGLN